MGYYQAGDFYGPGSGYYRGAYGDPGLFSWLGGAAKTIGGVIGKVLPIAAPIVGGVLGGPVGAALGGAAGGLIGGAFGGGGGEGAVAATAPGTTGMAMIPAPGRGFAPLATIPAAIGYATGTVARYASKSFSGGLSRGAAPRGGARSRRGGGYGIPAFGRRRRRINALNPRALRRALRRAKGFEHFAKKVMHLTRPKPGKLRFKFPRRKKRA